MNHEPTNGTIDETTDPTGRGLPLLGMECTVRRRKAPSAADLRRERRWDLADEAPRLLEEVPSLASLRMVVHASADGKFTSAPKYTRLFVLDSAPAYFWIPCSNPGCEEGGHDVTRDVISGLKAGKKHITGQSECCGVVRDMPCTAAIRFEVEASYVAG